MTSVRLVLYLAAQVMPGTTILKRLLRFDKGAILLDVLQMTVSEKVVKFFGTNSERTDGNHIFDDVVEGYVVRLTCHDLISRSPPDS